jgi:hypothetical protein
MSMQHPLSYRLKASRLLPRLSVTPAQLHQLHLEHGHLFVVTAQQQVRGWLGPGLTCSAPGPDLFGVNDLLDECAREFLRYCPHGGVFAVREQTLRVVHHPREQAIAELVSPRSSGVPASGQPARRDGRQLVSRVLAGVQR